MSTEYLPFVVQEMKMMLNVLESPASLCLTMAGTMTRFLNCDSLLDLAETHRIDRGALYKAVDEVSPPRWLRRLVKRGRERLNVHLRKWHASDPSYRSRHPITLAADDFTRTARGEVGGWQGLFYSGAKHGVVQGINIEALVAVIGDGDEVLILDVRIVPPSSAGPGRPALNQNQWLRRALRQLNAWLCSHGTNLKGCNLSVDAAYVSPDNVESALSMGIHMVGKLSVNRKVVGKVWGVVIAPAQYFAAIDILLNPQRCHDLRGEEGVEFQRHHVYVKSLKIDVLMVSFIHGKDLLLYFSTNQNMKTITLRNVIRYRWQLERLFWILKQDIGVGDIHHHKENRVETRIYLQFILAQVTRDAAAVFHCTPKDIVRAIRRSPTRLLIELGFPSAFAEADDLGPVREVTIAA